MSEKNKISRLEVHRIADLARLNLTDQEKELYANQLSDILESFEALNELEVGDYEKFDHYDLKSNNLRGDRIQESSETEKEAMKDNFPDRDGDFLSVKSVM